MAPLPTLKLEQVAIYAEDPEKVIRGLGERAGLTQWTRDIAIADGYVFGEPVYDVIGELAFNYQAVVELEVLHYRTPLHWHAVRRARGAFPANQSISMFPSHMGMHVEDMALARLPYEALGWKVAQELWTKSHTNQYLLDRGRTYHYVVWDSRGIIGFDLKLIQRIERKGA